MSVLTRFGTGAAGGGSSGGRRLRAWPSYPFTFVAREQRIILKKT
jgi:hypothetical protein